MYQTVGHDGISMYSEAMGLPLFRRKIFGTAVVQEKDYSPTEGDEVEDLYSLLSDIKVGIFISPNLFDLLVSSVALGLCAIANLIFPGASGF